MYIRFRAQLHYGYAAVAEGSLSGPIPVSYSEALVTHWLFRTAGRSACSHGGDSSTLRMHVIIEELPLTGSGH